jgi:hypothetical protein
MLKKKIWANFQRIIELFTKKIVTKLLKYGFGIRDPRSGIRKNPDPGSEIRDPEKSGSGIRDPGSGKIRIPDPGVKKAPVPGSGSATLYIKLRNVTNRMQNMKKSFFRFDFCPTSFTKFHLI